MFFAACRKYSPLQCMPRWLRCALLLLAARVQAFVPRLPGIPASGSKTPRSFVRIRALPRGTLIMSTCAVLFDFDGTLGDTETPAMEVAFWEVAPFIPALPIADDAALQRVKTTFIEDNAGRAFEFMVDDLTAERVGKGLQSVEDAWKEGVTDAKVLAVINPARAKFGLPPLEQTAGHYSSILQQQKEETNQALAVCTVPNPGVPELCAALTGLGVPYCISTTSGKPRVPISVKAAGLESFFPPDKIHSGESDFEPPRFKPDPAVYLKAAESEGVAPAHCIAVEDSGSGVGSAANAGLGLIIGYVGGTHIPADKKDSHAKMLMSGSKSKDGRGAELVVEEIANVKPLVQAFQAHRQQQQANGRFVLKPEVVRGLTGRVWQPETGLVSSNGGAVDHQ